MEPRRGLARAPDRGFPRLVITGVAPVLNGGRYAVKRLEGDELRVGADVFKDGHDVLAARICYRAPGERHVRTAPLTYSFEEDRWFGSVRLDRVGDWWFTVEGWVDPFATWRS